MVHNNSSAQNDKPKLADRLDFVGIDAQSLKKLSEMGDDVLEALEPSLDAFYSRKSLLKVSISEAILNTKEKSYSLKKKFEKKE